MFVYAFNAEEFSHLTEHIIKDFHRLKRLLKNRTGRGPVLLTGY
jgi:hypothetical protein